MKADRIHIRILAAFLTAALLCSGCSTSEPPEGTEVPAIYEYTEVYQRIQEPYSPEFAFRGNMLHTVVGKRTYEFTPAIPEEQRNAFVSAQEKLCALLQAHGVSTDGLTFRILADYRNWTDSENKAAYYGSGTAETWEQVLTTLQAALGDYTNYGYLYALADEIAGELDWQRDAVESDGFLEDSSLLNLVYPCFDEAYTTPRDIASCKAVAKELLSGLENAWSEEEFLRSRAVYAQSHGLDFDPTYITFAFYSSSCPLKLKTHSLEVFRDYTYVQDSYVAVGYVTEDYFASTKKIVDTFQWLDEQLASLRETFRVQEAQIIPVQLKDSIGESGNLSYIGYFNVRNESCGIYAKTVLCLGHEYVHYLTWLRYGSGDPAYEMWMGEALAYYYSLGMAFELDYLRGTNADPDWMAGVEALIGEPFDEPMDHIRYLRKSLRREENVSYRYYLQTENLVCGAFGEYFVRIYGEEAFLQSMLTPSRVQEITGRTMDEIVEAFCLDMADPAFD